MMTLQNKLKVNIAKNKYDDDVKKAKNLDYKKKFEDLQASIEGDDGVNAKLKNITTERDDYKSKYETLNKEYSILNATNKVTNAGIKPEFAKFVANEVLEMTSDSIDFDTALKSYKAKNPQYNNYSSQKKFKYRFGRKLTNKSKWNKSNYERFNSFGKRLAYS